ncbi:hypothetical protein [Methylomagnum sp.]
MEPTGRFFLCGRCRAQVLLCGPCDRGQIYCGHRCSEAARSRSQREAGRRYQHSRRGRFAHAERARRYRQRRENVTHQGSPAGGAGGALPPPSTGAALRVSVPAIPPPITAGRCHRCGRTCAELMRIGFRRRRGTQSRVVPLPEKPSTCP